MADAYSDGLKFLQINREYPQPIVAGTGTYFIVGHNPAGEERVMRLEVVND